METTSVLYRSQPHVSAAKAAGSVVLFDLHAGKYYTLNEVAGRIWELMELGATLEGILFVLGSEYDVDSERVKADTTAILEALLRAGLAVREVVG